MIRYFKTKHGVNLDKDFSIWVFIAFRISSSWWFNEREIVTICFVSFRIFFIHSKYLTCKRIYFGWIYYLKFLKDDIEYFLFIFLFKLFILMSSLWHLMSSQFFKYNNVRLNISCYFLFFSLNYLYCVKIIMIKKLWLKAYTFNNLSLLFKVFACKLIIVNTNIQKSNLTLQR